MLPQVPEKMLAPQECRRWCLPLLSWMRPKTQMSSSRLRAQAAASQASLPDCRYPTLCRTGYIQAGTEVGFLLCFSYNLRIFPIDIRQAKQCPPADNDENLTFRRRFPDESLCVTGRNPPFALWKYRMWNRRSAEAPAAAGKTLLPWRDLLFPVPPALLLFCGKAPPAVFFHFLPSFCAIQTHPVRFPSMRLPSV